MFAQIRMLNEFGGFFGQGTQVDVRQRGCRECSRTKEIQPGDVYLNQSAFTLHADEGEASDPWGHAYAAQRNLAQEFSRKSLAIARAQANASFKGDRWIDHVVLDGYVTRHADRVNFRNQLARRTECWRD